MDLLIGFTLSAIVSIAAFKRKSLSISGVIAAVIIGTSIYYCGGVIPYSVMIIFFISSSIISKVKTKGDNSRIDTINEKGSCRDYRQVLANGGVALVMISIYKITQDNLFFIATLISFSISIADTWGSEIGKLFNSKVINITTFKSIEKGLSGGVSLIGTVASALGALLIASIYYFFSSEKIIIDAFIIFIFGFLGSIVDSILGSVLQGKYIDEISGNITEKKISLNGNHNKLQCGLDFINNDAVNILSNVLVVSIAILILD